MQPTVESNPFQQAITLFHQESFTTIRLTEMASLTHQRKPGLFSLPFSTLCTVRVLLVLFQKGFETLVSVVALALEAFHSPLAALSASTTSQNQ